MNRDDQSPADSASTLEESDPASTRGPAADDEPTLQRPRRGEDARPRRSLAENWAAFANPSPAPADEAAADDGAETPSIHVAVSDALDGALADGGPAPSESLDDGVLPPPPDRSGTSFGTWDPEGDDRDRPEFFGDIADETSSSASDWRARLIEARAAESASRPLLTLGDPDEDEPGPPEGAREIAPLLVDDDDDAPVGLAAGDDEGDAPGDEAAEAAEVAELAEAAEAAEDDGDDEAAEAADAAQAPAEPPAPPRPPPERVQPTTVGLTPGLPHLAWTPIAVDDIDDDEEDEEAALLALARQNELGERRVMIDRGDGDGDDDLDAVRPRSRAISGEIIDDHQLGVVTDDDDAPPPSAPPSAPPLAPPPAPEEIAPPRPREAWIADESDPPADFYGATLSPERWQDPASTAGRVLLGRYRLGEVLGDGGEGFRVHAAVTTVGARPLVVKLVGPEHPATDERARLFRREARTMARLGHPRVAEVIDVGTTRDGLSFMVCARIDGPSLAELLERERRLPWQKAAPILRQILEVTDAVQHRGLVHRTIHPGNCYLAGERDGVPQVVLTNVGITPLCTNHRRLDGSLALTTEGLLGAAEYMAPEVVSGNLPDHRADIYALGVLFYELLLGEPPFAADGLLDLLKKHLYDPPPPPRSHPHGGEIPEAFEAVILRALAKDPEERYPNVHALADDLAAAEARQHEIERAKTLLSGLDAALWGDESGAGATAREEPAESGPRELPPIAPLTDDDKPPEERSGLPRTTAQLPAIADREVAAKPAGPAVTPPPPDAQPEPSSTRSPLSPLSPLIMVGALVLLIAVLIMFRPGASETPGPTTPGPTKVAAGAQTGGERPGPPPPAPGPDDAALRPPPALPPEPPPPELAPPDPSEGALDPSEGAFDPSEGAPPDPTGDAPPTEEAPPSDPAPAKKKASGPAEGLSAATIHAKLGGLRSRVSRECGMSGGLFAPVGLTIKVSVTVDPSGQVTASPAGGATKMGQCAARIVEGLRFPATRRGGSAVHSFKL